MKLLSRIFLLSIFILLCSLIAGNVCLAVVELNKAAPLFQEKDSEGNLYDLSALKTKSMIILYFFDVESGPSQEMFLNLVGLSKKYDESDMTVLGITRSDPRKVAQFIQKTGPGFPIIIDSSDISRAYQATMILPTVCIIGPDLKVLDYFQGGGKTTEMMLVRLAERTLQRNQTVLAKDITEEAIKQNPENANAKNIAAIIELKQGNVDQALADFDNLSKSPEKNTQVLGDEGKIAVHVHKGETEKALELARQVKEKAPERPLPYIVEGDELYRQNRKDEAGKEWEKAAQKKDGELIHKVQAYDQFGRFLASVGEYDHARRLYDLSVETDPYNIVAMSNKGVTYEKEDNWEMAFDAYQKALSINSMDTFSMVLAQRAQEMINLQKDAQKKERVDRLVKELAERFRKQESTRFKKDEDTWTSRPMILSFVDIQEQGGLAERDGLSTVIATGISSHLNDSGRVQVVERLLIERLLEELNLGSSELADPETTLRLGQILAAKLLGTGTVFILPGATLLNLRLIDTETTAIAQVFSEKYPSMFSLEQELDRLNRQILNTIEKKYPLRGFIVQVDDNQVMINIGSKQGVLPGISFEVLEEQKPIKYKGRMLQPEPLPVATIEIKRVDQDFSFATILSQDRSFKVDSKVQEKIDN